MKLLWIIEWEGLSSTKGKIIIQKLIKGEKISIKTPRPIKREWMNLWSLLNEKSHSGINLI